MMKTMTVDMKMVAQIAEEAAILRQDVDRAVDAHCYATARQAETEFLRALEIIGFPGVKRSEGGAAHYYVFDLDAAIAELEAKGGAQ